MHTREYSVSGIASHTVLGSKVIVVNYEQHTWNFG
jgi:hypothetical protein